ncbi:hypothetical protein RhiTH_011764 [Rhizoctonia solani]|uniref:Homeobox domain-containing protein n=1 Tax=Rhizoctonia solani TaxID=456999 RepID=A0A8H7H046_9AGAM|nr:hypothetical protein RHS04_09332 [Rhizoctonia solani]
MNDSPMLRALSAIQATVHQHIALSQGRPVTQHAPLFDAHSAPPLKSSLSEISNRLSSLGLSTGVAAEINNVLAIEGHSYQASIIRNRQQLLDNLSTVTVSSSPQALPSLIEATCQKFYNVTIDSCIDSVQKYLDEYTQDDDSLSDQDVSGSGDDSPYESGEDDEASDSEEQEVDEDDNTPMKVGEEVPPLETKYLPIFEALHERGKVLTKPEKTYLVNMTGMTYRQITIWFQNRRRGELKEGANQAHSMRADSVYSFGSSDISEEVNLEQQLSNARSGTNFDIRSWRLTSAYPIKHAVVGSSAPPSPTKFLSGTSMVPGSDTDDTDSLDSDNDELAPPGLHGSSLSMSTTTTLTSAESIQLARGVSEPMVVSASASTNEQTVSTRPTKALPASRRGTSSTLVQSTQVQVPTVFDGSSAQSAFCSSHSQSPTHPAHAPSPPTVTSDERGLTVELSIGSQASALTLFSFLPSPPTMSAAAPSSAPHTASAPCPRNTSPTPSAHSGSSPRLLVKPPPRRTGCAPRPRPPPRPSPPSNTTSAVTPSSARASVVLPPSSNPSLGSTTLGSLLRPNQPAPRIPPEMEERLAAMAGRMGVGRDRNSNATAEQATSVVPSASRPGFVFGPTLLPTLGLPPGSIPAVTSDKLPRSPSRLPQP